MAADLSHSGLAHDSDHKVNWETPTEGGAGGTGGASEDQQQDAEEPATPTVTAVAITSDPGDDDTYRKDDVIQVTVTFSETVDVDTTDGTPRLTIDMDPADWGSKWAGYASGSGTATLTFTHTVVEPNLSTQGIAVLADTLELNGGTIESTAADMAADLSHSGLAHDADHKVNWEAQEEGGAGGTGGASEDGQEEEEPTTPTVSAVAITSDPGSDDTYRKGDVIQVTVTFSEDVDVDTTDGTPHLSIKMDPDYGEKQASYASGSGSTSLTFTYTVAQPNLSTQGIAVLANTLALNGGSIESTAADADADLSHTGLAHDADHKVDWRTTPTVTAVAVTSDPGSDDTYRKDDVIQVTVTFSETVDVDTTDGTPRLTIKMDPEYGEKWASYQGGSGTASLTFAFTVVEPNFSDEGIAVLADTLQLNGGSIESTAADMAADLTHTGLAHDADHQVDWQQGDEGASTT